MEKNIKNRINIFLNKSKNKFGDKYEFPFIKDEYVTSHSKITIKCKECGNIFNKIALDHLTSNNGGCKNCRLINKAELINYNDLKNKIKGNDVKPFNGLKNIKKDNVIAICPIHGEYTAKLKSVLKNKYKCKICALINDNKSNKKISRDKANTILQDLCKDNISYNIEEYNGTQCKMTFTCLKCNNSFERKYNNFLSNNKCPFCYKQEYIDKKIKSTEKYIEEAKNIYGDKYSYENTLYTASKNKVLVTCNECGKIFEIEANSHLQGHGCPYHNFNTSNIEKEILTYMNDIYDGEILSNNRQIISPNEIDIYIPEFKIGFEIDGLYWHNEINKPDKNYHLYKTIECESKDIRLIHIFEDEWIYKKNIWKSMISNILGKTDTKIYARNCEVREITDSKIASEFLDSNHIQGKCGSSVKLGLYYNNELVSLMTFGKSRHFVGSCYHGEYELLRFCNKLNTVVIGGASKLFNYFVKKYNPESIISYADRRWSQGNLYEKLGFSLYNKSNPNYYYVIKNKRFYRFNFRKDQLIKKYNCPPNMTEKQFCFEQGWYRIYDCGCLCYLWESNS